MVTSKSLLEDARARLGEEVTELMAIFAGTSTASLDHVQNRVTQQLHNLRRVALTLRVNSVTSVRSPAASVVLGATSLTSRHPSSLWEGKTIPALTADRCRLPALRPTSSPLLPERPSDPHAVRPLAAVGTLPAITKYYSRTDSIGRQPAPGRRKGSQRSAAKSSTVAAASGRSEMSLRKLTCGRRAHLTSRSLRYTPGMPHRPTSSGAAPGETVAATTGASLTSVAQVEGLLLFTQDCLARAASAVERGVMEAATMILAAIQEDVDALRVAAAIVTLPGGEGREEGEVTDGATRQGHLPLDSCAWVRTGTPPKPGGLDWAHSTRRYSAVAAPDVADASGHVSEEELPLAIQAFLRTTHYDILMAVCEFYTVLSSDHYLDRAAVTLAAAQVSMRDVMSCITAIARAAPFVSGSTVQMAAANAKPSVQAHWATAMPSTLALGDLLVSLETAVQRNAATSEVDTLKTYRVADAGYHLIFSGTAYVTEMSSFLLQRTALASKDFSQNLGSATVHFDEAPLYQYCAYSMGTCVELCEANSATLRLATVKYLPWRDHLYDVIAQCYEQLEQYQHALQVATRALYKARELIEIEFIDTAPPSPSHQRTLRDTALRAALQVVKYTWYQTLLQAGTTTDSPPAAANDANTNSSGADGAGWGGGGAPGGVPHSGLELIQAVWSVLEKDPLPAVGGSGAATGQSTNSLHSGKSHPSDPFTGSQIPRTTGGNGGKRMAQHAEAEAQMVQVAQKESVRRHEVMKLFLKHAMPFFVSLLVAHRDGGSPLTTQQQLKSMPKRTGSPAAASLTASRSTSRRGVITPPIVLSFATLRAAAREAIEMLVNLCCKTYWAEHREALCGAPELYPFPLPEISELHLSTSFANGAVPLPVEAEEDVAALHSETAAVSAGHARGRGAASKKKKRRSSQPTSARQSPGSGSSVALSPPHHAVLPSLLEDPMWSAEVTWAALFPALCGSGDGARDDVAATALCYPALLQRDVIQLLSMFRGISTTSRSALYIGWCAVSIHMLRSVVGAAQKTSRRHSRLHLLDTAAETILMLQRLKYATLVVRGRLRDLDFTRVMETWQGRLRHLAEAANHLPLLGTASVYHTPPPLREASESSDHETAYPLVSPLLAPAEALCELASRLGGRRAVSTRQPPHAPLYARTANATYAASCLHEVIIDEASHFIMQEAESIIRNRREQRAAREMLNITDGPFMDPESPSQRAVPHRTEDEVDAIEERAYLHVVVRVVAATLASGRGDPISLGALAVSMAASVCRAVQAAQGRIRETARGRDGAPAVVQHPSAHPTASDPIVATAASTVDGNAAVGGRRRPELLLLFERTRLTLSFAKMAQQQVIERQDHLRNQARCHSPSPQHLQRQLFPQRPSTSAHGKDVSNDCIKAVTALRMKEDERQKVFAQQLSDSRTYLSRYIIDLSWYAALLRSQSSAFKQRQVDIKVLLERQMNTAVYGITTSKETRILQTLLNEEPDLPPTPEEEEARLMSCAMHDPTLRALTLLSLARLLHLQKLHTRAKERLDLGMEVLMSRDRQDVMQTDGCGSAEWKSSEKEPPVFSDVILWSLAASTCSLLGALHHADAARSVLYTWFVVDPRRPTAEAAAATHGDQLLEDGAADDAEDGKYLLAPNAQALEDSSDTALLTLCRALYDVSGLELASVQPRDDSGGDQPLFQQQPQLVGLRCAYRTLFALQVAHRVTTRCVKEAVAAQEASALSLSCANLILNALLPCLRDNHFARPTLPPLVGLCCTLLGLSGAVWVDATVQLLGFRVVSMLNDVLSRIRDGANMPSEKLQKLRYVMLRTFTHAWNNVVDHPSPRQARYSQQIRARSIEVRQVAVHNAAVKAALAELEGDAGSGGGGGATTATTVTRRNRKVPSPAIEDLEGNAASLLGHSFAGSAYAPEPDSLLIDDRMPVEYVQLAEEMIFTVPGALPAAMSPTPCSKPSPAAATQRAASRSFTPSPATSGGAVSDEVKLQQEAEALLGSEPLKGVPPILLEVGNAITVDGGSRALDVLQNHKADPLYAKCAVRLVEFYLARGDYTAALKVTTTALEGSAAQWQDIQEHEAETYKQLRLWLISKGYVITGDKAEMGKANAAMTRRNSRTPSRGAKPSPRGKMGRRAANEEAVRKAAAREAAEAAASEKFLRVTRVWTQEEREMLGVVTRGITWIRRRQAARWLHRRFFQFNGVFQAQLRMHLAALLRQEWASAQQGPSAVEEEARWSRTQLAGGSASHPHPGPQSGVSSSGWSNSARGPLRGRGVTTQVSNANPVEEVHVGLARHAAYAANLFSRAVRPAFTLRAAQQVLEDVQRNVTAGALPFAHIFLTDDGTTAGHTLSVRSSVAEGDVDRMSVASSTATTVGKKHFPNAATLEKLRDLSPHLLKLALELLNALSLVQMGLCDHRRDAEILQPAAIKTEPYFSRRMQLRWHGVIPSLLTYMSPVGQHEEARIASQSKKDGLRRQGQAAYWMEECMHEELLTRRVLLEHEALARTEILDDLVAVVPAAGDALRAQGEEARRVVLCVAEDPGDDRRSTKKRRRCGTAAAHHTARDTGGRRVDAPSLSDGLAFSPFLPADDDRVGNMVEELPVQRKKLGPDMPEEVVAETLAHLAHALQFTHRKEVVQLCLHAHRMTQGRYATYFLPLAIAMQQAMGLPQRELSAAYRIAVRDAPLGATLLRSARSAWARYAETEVYRHNKPCWGLSMPPSVPAGKRAAAETSTGSLESPAAPSPAVQRVLAAYEAAADRLRADRQFGLLGECLLEMGRIHLLLRDRTEAERLWLEAVDTLLEVPRCMQRWRQVWANAAFAPERIGLPRILLAITALSSLAMFLFRQQQTRAVDAYLLSAMLLQLFFASGVSVLLPGRLFDYTAFVFQDIMVLSHLGTQLKSKIADITHHLLYIAHELNEFHYYPQGALVAALAEYLARRFLLHVKMVVDANLIRAQVAVNSGNVRAAMQIMSGVCRGANLPCASLHLILQGQQCSIAALRSTAIGMDKGAAKKQVSGSHGVSGGYTGSITTPTEEGLLMESEAPLYRNEEPPTSPINIASITVFLSYCLPQLNVDPILFPIGPPTTSGASPAAAAASGGPLLPSGLMHEAVCEAYGSLLSRRVLLTVVDVLVAIATREGGTYLWPYGMVGVQAGAPPRHPTSRDATNSGNARSRTSNTAQKTRSACVDALKVAEYLLDIMLTQESSRQAGGAASATTGKDRPHKSSPKRTTSIMAKALPVSGEPEDLLEVRASLRHRAVLLKALAATARGDSEAAVALLLEQLQDYNSSGAVGENSDLRLGGRGYQASAVAQLPSFFMTIGHTYWCRVLLCLTSSYFRLRDNNGVEAMVARAEQLCGLCGDAYSFRIFSLYRASALAQQGLAADAIHALTQVRAATDGLSFEGGDPLAQWLALAQVTCGRLAMNTATKATAPTIDPALLNSLRASAQLMGLQPWLPSTQGDRSQAMWWVPSHPDRATSTLTRIHALKYHAAINAHAQTVLRRLANYTAPSTGSAKASVVSELHDVSMQLRLVLEAVAAQYGTRGHPALSTESKLLLAQAYMLSDALAGRTVAPRTPAAAAADAHTVSTASTDNLLSTFPTASMAAICSLLMEVIDLEITQGGHCYFTLRTALLELAVLLARAGPPYAAVSSACLVLGFLTNQMIGHVFSGPSAFFDYNTDETMTTDFGLLKSRFPQSVLSIVKGTLRGVDQVLSGGAGMGDRLAPPVNRFYVEHLSHLTMPPMTAPTARRSSRFGTLGRDAQALQTHAASSVTIQDVVKVFAILHRGKLSCDLLPPSEVADHETALISVRAFLQEKAVPPACTYLCYPADVRAAILKQLNPQRGGAPAGGSRGSRGSTASNAQQQQQDIIDLWSALVPQVLLGSTPDDLFTLSGSPDLFCAPRINSVFTASCQSFSASRSEFVSGGVTSLAPTDLSSSPTNTTLLIAVSPWNDPTLTEAPSIISTADRKRILRRPESAAGAAAVSSGVGASSGSSAPSAGTVKARQSSTTISKPRAIGVDAALAERLHELQIHADAQHSPAAGIGASPKSVVSSGRWRCVAIDLSTSIVQEMAERAEQVLDVMASLDAAAGRIAAAGSEMHGSATPAAANGTVIPTPANLPATPSRPGGHAVATGAAAASSGSAALAQSLITATIAMRQAATTNSGGPAGATGSGRGKVNSTRLGASSNSGGGTAPAATLNGAESRSVQPPGSSAPGSGQGTLGLSARLREGDGSSMNDEHQQRLEALCHDVDTLTDRLHVAKSELVMGLVDALVKRYLSPSVPTELLDSCTQRILPECSVDRTVVKFLRAWLQGCSGSAAQFFHPGVHAWMSRIVDFVEHPTASSA